MLVAAAFAAAMPVARAAASTVLPTALASHAPIDIENDANFTAVNGVVSGTGTAANPYVIAGWLITAPPFIGVQIRNTQAHVVVRDVEVTLASVAGFYFFGVSNVTLANVTAYANLGEGVRFESSHAFLVAASDIAANNAGVSILDSAGGTVQGNNVTLNTGDGLAVANSPFVTVAANNVSLNGFGNSGYGIHLASSTNDTVTGNRFFRNGIFLDGTSPEHFDSHTIPADNSVSGLPILYERDCNGLGLSGMALGGLLVANCRHVRVSNLTISGGDVGVELVLSTDVTLGPNVTVSEAATGVASLSSDSVRFVDGAILDTGIGIDLESTTRALVSGSKIASPSSFTLPLDAIAVHASDTVSISGNILRHHSNGVETENSGNVTLLGNVVSLDTAGFNAYRTRDFVLRGNLFVQDGSGIRLLDVTNGTVEENEILGAFTYGAYVNASTGVLVAHNTFSGNAENSYDDLPAGNAWDAGYPSGGNFWGNYRGVDAYQGPSQDVPGPDGIGDSPYLFQVNATDRYPLMVAPVSVDVPPEALFSVSPVLGNVRTVFSVNANFSSDWEDPLSQLPVRWAWDDGAAWGPWTTAKSATHVYPVPGDHTIHLEVRDTAGLTDTWTRTVNVAPKPDGLPPIIRSTPVTSADVGQPIRITANITDPSGLSNATLLYRGVDAVAFAAVPMGYVNGTNYSATIPGQPRAGTLEYVIVANDSWGNPARSPLTGETTVVIVDPLLSTIVIWVLPAALGAAVIAVAAYLVWRRRRKTPPRGEPAAPPGNP